ncbi:MAG: hypothetical protein LUI60_03700 [Clostridia bacterium]|nr:hypothetical protein [Clostridia bacterium]
MEYEEWKQIKEYEERLKKEKEEQRRREQAIRDEQWMRDYERRKAEEQRKTQIESDKLFEEYISGGLFVKKKDRPLTQKQQQAEGIYRSRQKMLWESGYNNTYKFRMSKNFTRKGEREKELENLRPSWSGGAERAAKHFKRSLVMQKFLVWVLALFLTALVIGFTMCIFYGMLSSSFASIILFAGGAFIAIREVALRYAFAYVFAKYSAKDMLYNVGDYSLIKMQEMVRYYSPSVKVNIFTEKGEKEKRRERNANIASYVLLAVEVVAFFLIIVLDCLMNSGLGNENVEVSFYQVITETRFMYYFIFEFINVMFIAVKNFSYADVMPDYCPVCGTCNVLKRDSVSYISERGATQQEWDVRTPTRTEKGTATIDGKTYDAEITYKGKPEDYVKYNYRIDKKTTYKWTYCSKCRNHLSGGEYTVDKKVIM